MLDGQQEIRGVECPACNVTHYVEATYYHDCLGWTYNVKCRNCSTDFEGRDYHLDDLMNCIIIEREEAMGKADFVKWFNSYQKVHWFDGMYLELYGDDEVLIHRQSFMGWSLDKCIFTILSEHSVYVQMGSRRLECFGIPLAKVKRCIIN